MKKIAFVPLFALLIFSLAPLSAGAQACTSDGAPCGSGGTCRVDLEGTFYCDTTNAIQNPITNTNQSPQTSTGAGSVNMQWLIYYADSIVWVVNYILVPVLMAIAFIVFLWGVFKYFIYGADNDTERATGRKFVLWGIIGFVIITSVWGLVNIVKTTVIPSSAGSNRPAYPTL